MIPFDFDYYRPDTLEEAAECYHRLVSEGKSPLYYGGGTEVISMARARSIRFDAVIDLGGIPACVALEIQGDDLVIGAAVTLTAIAESGCYPLLGKTVARIADHTIQDKITLGGNLGGTILYREAALPLMLADCRVSIMTAYGLREQRFSQIFDGRLQLDPGDFLVQVMIGRSDLHLPYVHVKRTKMDKIDYPLITLTADKKDGVIRAAVSGAGKTPILLPSDALNHTDLPEEERVAEVVARISGRIIGDLHGSREYRVFVLRGLLAQMFENLKGA